MPWFSEVMVNRMRSVIIVWQSVGTAAVLFCYVFKADLGLMDQLLGRVLLVGSVALTGPLSPLS